jgi:hypothetical protein
VLFKHHYAVWASSSSYHRPDKSSPGGTNLIPSLCLIFNSLKPMPLNVRTYMNELISQPHLAPSCLCSYRTTSSGITPASTYTNSISVEFGLPRIPEVDAQAGAALGAEQLVFLLNVELVDGAPFA